MCVSVCVFTPGLDPAVLRDDLFEHWNRRDLQMVRVTFTACVNFTHAILSVCVCVSVFTKVERCSPCVSVRGTGT